MNTNNSIHPDAYVSEWAPQPRTIEFEGTAYLTEVDLDDDGMNTFPMLERITLPNRHCFEKNYVERLRDAEAWEVALAVPGDDIPVQSAREALEDIGLAVRLCEHMNQLENA